MSPPCVLTTFDWSAVSLTSCLIVRRCVSSLTVFLGTAVFNFIHPGQFLPHAPETGTAQEHGSPDTMTLQESKHKDGNREGLTTGERLA